jgi:hypothetical protein
MAVAPPVIRPPLPRDLGPPTPAEQVTIARILIRYGYPPPRPLGADKAKPVRPW